MFYVVCDVSVLMLLLLQLQVMLRRLRCQPTFNPLPVIVAVTVFAGARFVFTTLRTISNCTQGCDDGPKAGTSGASEAAQAKPGARTATVIPIQLLNPGDKQTP